MQPTPKMLKAGVMAYMECDGLPLTHDQVIQRIWDAMETAAPSIEPDGYVLVTKSNSPVTWHTTLYLFDPSIGGISHMPATADKHDPQNAPHRWAEIRTVPLAAIARAQELAAA